MVTLYVEQFFLWKHIFYQKSWDRKGKSAEKTSWDLATQIFDWKSINTASQIINGDIDGLFYMVFLFYAYRWRTHCSICKLLSPHPL
jgi:hypothetical protein